MIKRTEYKISFGQFKICPFPIFVRDRLSVIIYLITVRQIHEILTVVRSVILRCNNAVCYNIIKKVSPSGPWKTEVSDLNRSWAQSTYAELIVTRVALQVHEFAKSPSYLFPSLSSGLESDTGSQISWSTSSLRGWNTIPR